LSKWGKDFNLNRYYYDVGDNWQSLGGIPKPCYPESVAREIAEPGTGTRRFVTLDVAERRFRISPTLLLQRLSPYLTTYAIASGEAAIAAHQLDWTDGVETKKITDCKVNRCSFTIPHGDKITCELEIFGKNIATQTKTPTWETYTERTLTFKNVSLFQIDDINVTNWKRLEFGVNNHVAEESLGTEPKPAEVEELEAEYFARVILSRKFASYLGSVGAGNDMKVEIGITDNQPTPVTTTFTFTEAVLTRSRIEVPGMGFLLERLEFRPRKLTIT